MITTQIGDKLFIHLDMLQILTIIADCIYKFLAKQLVESLQL